MKCIFCNAPSRTSTSKVCEVCYKNLSPLRRERLAEYEAKCDLNSEGAGWTAVTAIITRPYVLAILAFLSIFVIRHFHLFPQTAPKVVLESNSQESDPCFQKKRCLIVYVAPWCGACQGEVPFLGDVQKFVNSHPNVGFKVYVGADEVGNLRRFASTIHAATFIDSDSSVGKGLGVHAFPSFFWLNEKGKIIDEPIRSYVLLPDKTQVESYFLGVLEDDKEIIFGA